MDREIEFRGKQLSSGEWLYGDLMHDNQGGCYVYPLDCHALFVENKVDPDTVGQFTCLRDKNGVKIFEGDIIRFVNGQKKVNGEWVDNEFIYAVEYSSGAFRGVLGLSKSLDAVEVIGNIHNNPELFAAK